MTWMTQDWTTGQLNALVKNLGGEKVARGILDGTVKFVVSSVENFLTLLRTVRIPAQPAVTTSKEYFKEAGVVITGSNFENQFYGLEVTATEEAKLAVRRLERDSPSVPILTELGDKAETNVSQFRAFLAENRKSTEWFIFYLRGKDGSLWAVGARWDVGGGGWRVSAGSVGGPTRWRAGGRVVSRN